jgi:hypothetical protein
MHCPTFPGELQCYAPTRQAMIAYLREMGAPAAVIELQEAAGSTSPLWVEPAQLAEDRHLTAQPAADANDYVAPPEEELTEPPPPPRRPRPREHYGYPPPPPGTIFIPAERRVMQCLPTLLTLGIVRLCI